MNANLAVFGLSMLLLIYFLLGAQVILYVWKAARRRDWQWTGIMIQLYAIWGMPMVVLKYLV